MRVPEPMYATIADAMPVGDDWTFEQKYDGMRVLAAATARRTSLVTRNGRDKRSQFPEIAAALTELAAAHGRSLLLDGEIVALARGRPAPFQALQSRMHRANGVESIVARRPAAIVLFDVLKDGRSNLMKLPHSARRERLAAIVGDRDDTLRLSESSSSARRMLGRARRGGWEGLIAKRVSSTYAPGVRSRDWLKLKLQHRAEFVVGGYTEPRRSREHFGALALGYFDADGRFRYAGNMGAGFSRETLREVSRRLDTLGRKQSPFVDAVRAPERVHWVAPKVVVEVKFTEWTADGKLRQPTFLGVRDDKAPSDVHREEESVQHWAQELR
jgi:bifunctional non-homologous end joining protein LigD